MRMKGPENQPKAVYMLVGQTLYQVQTVGRHDILVKDSIPF